MRSHGILRIFLSVTMVFMGSARASSLPAQACVSTREFVATMEYFRAHSEFQISEPQAREIADRVSQGCDGAARRFVRVATVLMRSGLSTSDAFREGLTFAGLEDQRTETFLAVFSRAFSADVLDMDFRSSVALARALSSEFNGKSEDALADYERLAKFCVEEASLNQSRPACGHFAARLAKAGELYQQRVAETFFETFAYLTSTTGGIFGGPQGPGLTVADALRVSERIVAFGPVGRANFMDAYRYAVSEKGMGFPVAQALTFAEGMAARTFRPQTAVATDGKSKQPVLERSPAQSMPGIRKSLRKR